MFSIFSREGNLYNIDWFMQIRFHESAMFLDRDNKTKLVPASFSYFPEL